MVSSRHRNVDFLALIFITKIKNRCTAETQKIHAGVKTWGKYCIKELLIRTSKIIYCLIFDVLFADPGRPFEATSVLCFTIGKNGQLSHRAVLKYVHGLSFIWKFLPLSDILQPKIVAGLSSSTAVQCRLSKILGSEWFTRCHTCRSILKA